MDVWINFKNATKWQAEEIFKNFFPCKRPEPPTPLTPEGVATETKPKPRRKAPGPVLEEAELSDLAKRFADAIPEDEMSVSGTTVRGPSLG
jgi:chaperone BCS1